MIKALKLAGFIAMLLVTFGSIYISGRALIVGGNVLAAVLWGGIALISGLLAREQALEEGDEL